MKQIFIIKETQKICNILNDSYEAFLAALQKIKPSADNLVENDAISQAHDVYALIKLGQLKIGQMENDDGRFITLEIIF